MPEQTLVCLLMEEQEIPAFFPVSDYFLRGLDSFAWMWIVRILVFLAVIAVITICLRLFRPGPPARDGSKKKK